MADRWRLMAAISAFTLVSCADDGVASLGGAGTRAQSRRAEAMAACAVDAVIPATLMPRGHRICRARVPGEPG
ncbi:MAG: hypothetical protein LBK59_09775 [Bifidobacteriaceae bacterium]|nr:hypothetical protein [Bifidobacteriaceae bacterium]